MKSMLILLYTLPLLLYCASETKINNQQDIAKINVKPKITQWRGPNRNGIYSETGLLTRWPEGGPELLWQFSDLGCGYASPVVTDSMVYTIGTHEKTNYVYAFKHNGQLKYKTLLGPEWVKNYPGSRCTPLVVDSLGYFLSGLGKIYCFQLADGTTLWKKNIKTEYGGRTIQCGYSENLLVAENKLYCTPAGKDTNVVALDRFNGELIWASPAMGEKSSYGNPILIEHGGKTFFIQRTKYSAFSLDAGTGQLMWSHKLSKKKQANTPIFKDSLLLFIGDFQYNSVLLKLSHEGDSVKPVWESAEISADQGDVVILNQRIFGADSEAWEFTCVDWYTGKSLYDTHKNYPMLITIISAEGLLYCYDRDGFFYLYKPLLTKFEKRGTIDIPDTGKRKRRRHYSHPVIHNKRLYVRHQSNLCVYDIAAQA
ncbi:PQQ-like beta-propeller repeat protein [bacterium]|nr:PQQ-like beta-propeller repeat protein [bacterium]